LPLSNPVANDPDIEPRFFRCGLSAISHSRGLLALEARVQVDLVDLLESVSSVVRIFLIMAQP
jgi:hypothetical protein